MVDVDKVKPGDELEYIGDDLVYSGGAWLPFIPSMGQPTTPQIPNRSRVVVADPPTLSSFTGGTLVRIMHPGGSQVFVDPEYLSHISPHDEPADTPCVCDILSLMRVGCKCGRLAFEREAKNR